MAYKLVVRFIYVSAFLTGLIILYVLTDMMRPAVSTTLRSVNRTNIQIATPTSHHVDQNVSQNGDIKFEDPDKCNGELIDLDKTVPSVDEMYKRMALVTAISDNHYMEGHRHIRSIQKWMNDKEIIVYNLGMREETVKKLKQVCNVSIRRFPFEKYPPHVKNLHTYAFKPIIIEMTLKEFGVVFWGDASQQFNASVRELLPHVSEYNGFLAHWMMFEVPKPTGFHQYRYTVRGSFQALGVNRTEYYWSKLAPFPRAGQLLIVNGTTLQTKLVQPWLKCALDKNCIAPPGSSLLNHRYDSSVLNIIIYKNLKEMWTPEHNSNRYFDEVSFINRDPVGHQLAKFCSTDQNDPNDLVMNVA